MVTTPVSTIKDAEREADLQSDSNMSVNATAGLNCSLPFTDDDGGSCSGGARETSPVLHLPADFFHPAAAAHPNSPGNSVSPGDRRPSRSASPASWASLRSPRANSRPLGSQVLRADEWIRLCLYGWLNRRHQHCCAKHQ